MNSSSASSLPATSSAVSTSEISRRLIRGGVAVCFGRLIGIALSFVANILLARLLTKEDFGRYGLLLTSIITFGCIAKFGLDRLLLKHLSEMGSNASRQQLFKLLVSAGSIAAVSSCVAALIMLIALSPFEILRSSPEVVPLVILSVISMLLIAWLQLIAESFRGFHDLIKATLYDGQRSGVLFTIVFTPCLLAVAVSGWSKPLSLTFVLGVAVGIQLMLLVLALVDFSYSKLSVRPAVSLEHKAKGVQDLRIGAILPATATLAAIEFLSILSGWGDVWIAGALLDVKSLANWTVTVQLMQVVALPLLLINLTVVSAIPQLYQQGRIEELQSILQKSATVATLVSMFPLGAMILAPGPFISLLYGEQFSAAALPLAIVSIGKVILVWTGTCGMALLLTGHQKIVLVNNALAVLVVLLLSPLAIRYYGLNGLACVSAFVTIVSNLISWFAARVYLGIWTHGTPLIFLVSGQKTSHQQKS